MPTNIYNFGAGPAMLPVEVMKQAQAELVDFKGTGISVMETSHRAEKFSEVIHDARVNLCKLMGIGDDYEVLFLQGGASHQFAMLPMNLLADGETADYIDTGVWSQKAIKEIAMFGTANIVASSGDKKYSYIPDMTQCKFSQAASYVHYTSNNTIYGTQFHSIPKVGVPLISDMSSDIMCRPIDINAHGLIYAGSQKNIGPSGLALVIIKKDLIERSVRKVPTILSYATHANNGSLFNTPNTFAIYIVGLVAKWLQKLGGLEAMEQINQKKANLLYSAIDNSDGFYSGNAQKEARSIMNVTYRLPNEGLESKFVDEAESIGLKALKGHRISGGIRASIYNAMPVSGVEALVSFMDEFAKKNG